MGKNYEKLVQRNSGYIEPSVQERIGKSRVLIAGCGIGSQVAEAAARMGFQDFLLVDGDVVDSHNLNRQSFFADQVGKLKVAALSENIKRINPAARVRAMAENLSAANVSELLTGVDLVFDTIDFLDLPGIVALHDEAHFKKIPLISSFSVGFGAAIISLLPTNQGHAPIRDIFSLPSTGPIDSASYVERFQGLFASLASHLDPAVIKAMSEVFQSMADGKTCPAPQVVAGAHGVASLCMTAAVQILSGSMASHSAQIQIVNFNKLINAEGILLGSAAAIRRAA